MTSCFSAHLFAKGSTLERIILKESKFLPFRADPFSVERQTQLLFYSLRIITLDKIITLTEGRNKQC